MSESKRCTDCGVIKPLDAFSPHKRYKGGYTTQCKACRSAYSCRHAKAHPEQHRANCRRFWHRLRETIILEYGGHCVCCGESRPEFLAIHHIDGRGAQHRASIGTKIYRWLKQKGFPKDNFELLCHNCNMAHSAYGYCPHKKEELLWLKEYMESAPERAGAAFVEVSNIA